MLAMQQKINTNALASSDRIYRGSDFAVWDGQVIGEKIQCGIDLGRGEFGNGYSDDISFSLWWYPRTSPPLESGEDHSIFQWGTTINMYVEDDYIKIVFKDNESSVNTYTLSYQVTEAVYGTDLVNFNQWHLITFSFNKQSGTNECEAYIVNPVILADGSLDGAFTGSGDIPDTSSVGFNCASNLLVIGDDPSATSKKGAIKNSYLTGFSFYKQNISSAFRTWLHCGNDFKKRVFKPGFSEDGGTTATYGGEMNVAKHVLHLIPETLNLVNLKQAGIYHLRPRNVWFNDIKRNEPVNLGNTTIGKEHFKWHAGKPSLYGKDGLNPWRSGTTSSQGTTIGAGNWVEIASRTTIDYTSYGAVRNVVGHTFCVNSNMTLGLGDSVHRLEFNGMQPYGTNKVSLLYDASSDDEKGNDINEYVIEYVDNNFGALINFHTGGNFNHTLTGFNVYKLEVTVRSTAASGDYIVIYDDSASFASSTVELTTTWKHITTYLYSGSVLADSKIAFVTYSGNKIYLKSLFL